MTDETMPDWVLIEAAKQCGWVESRLERLRWYYNNTDNMGKAFCALCDMILKHEQPPVDRKLACAREAMAFRASEEMCADMYRGGVMDNLAAVQNCLRAIELWEEGFGK